VTISALIANGPGNKTVESTGTALDERVTSFASGNLVEVSGAALQQGTRPTGLDLGMGEAVPFTQVLLAQVMHDDHRPAVTEGLRYHFCRAPSANQIGRSDHVRLQAPCRERPPCPPGLLQAQW
jgi:hypothetical protein